MSQDFLDVLARHSGDSKRLDAAAKVLHTLSQQMVLVLDDLKDASWRPQSPSRQTASRRLLKGTAAAW
jgi:hypothetical protein